MISAGSPTTGASIYCGALFVLAVALAQVHVTYIEIITIEPLTLRSRWVSRLNSMHLQAHLDRHDHHWRRSSHDSV